MKKYAVLIMVAVFLLTAETLFQVKDSQDRVVLDVSTDGLRVYNEGDLLMEISSSDIRAFIDNDPTKGLARSFSVTTSSSSKGETNVLEVTTQDAKMREGDLGARYTGFSPDNVFLGLNSGISTVPAPGNNGKRNVFIGNDAGFSNVEGCSNVFIGAMAGHKSNNDFNVFIGFQSGKENVGGLGNTFVGDSSGLSNSWGVNNSYFGSSSGSYNTGNRNSVFGSSAGRGHWDANYSRNALFGSESGYNLETGSDNVLLGYRSGRSLSTGNGNIFIGSDAGYSETGSNKLYIANSSTVDPLIYGEFDNNIVKINGRLGVGVTPTRMLHVEDVTTTNDNPAIFGKHNVSNSWGVGVRGEGGLIGVDAIASATTYDIFGVRSFATGDGAGSRTGVFTSAGGGGVVNYGIYATTSGTAGTRWAGWFQGNVRVTGTFNNTKSETKVDHPLDPENRYLSHATVGSSEMINVYNGNAVLDTNGNARIDLPEWFESYNTDFRYQLTPVGAPALLYISQEIKNNEFEISGGTEGLKVSWQVTGTRKDNYALKNPVKIESNKKGDHVGLYINPEVFGFGEEKSIERAMDRERVSP